MSGPKPPESDRKDDHLQICLNNKDIDRASTLGSDPWAEWELLHDALPQCDLDEVSIATQFLGKPLQAPLMIGCMTGGTTQTGQINQVLARVASELGLAIGVGSQRKLIDQPELAASFDLKKWGPSIPLLMGNLGVNQLADPHIDADTINRLVNAIRADAFVFHLNPLQEAIQPEGDTRFAGLLERLQEILPKVQVPVLVKEVGCGISPLTIKKLKQLPLAAIDVAGKGGSSWSRIESYRTEDYRSRELGLRFSDWGQDTPTSILDLKREWPELPLIGSGGIRDGIQAAKSLALGADLVAMALPFAQAAAHSVDQCLESAQSILDEIKLSLFLTGSPDLQKFKTLHPIRNRRIHHVL